MLIVALILVAIAIILFAVEFAKSAFQSFIALGLGFFAGGIAAWLIDILHAQGKI